MKGKDVTKGYSQAMLGLDWELSRQFCAQWWDSFWVRIFCGYVACWES